jgi:uncharacterized protein
MSFAERAVAFSCDGARLIAIVSLPQRPLRRGVLIVVGGPQYRAGSHRQFTLLCRMLAEQGIAAMRFDYRGMGDAEGDMRTFEGVQTDIRVAIDQFCLQVPELTEVAIWGLCDAASAALFYAHADPRVSGVVLVNPWVRTSTGIAKAQLKHYYRSRLTDKEFWRKVAHGEFALAAAARSFAGTLFAALGSRTQVAQAEGGLAASSHPDKGAAASLPERMAEGLSRFKGKILLILSGRDLTAQEFNAVVRASNRWGELLSAGRVQRRDLPEADHTFSRREWRDQVIAWTAAWVRSW